ncbi:MAG TPA: protein kinase [Candidatus Polarisedimenticolia bacterium]|nr:protein kinase [Candidatus Polarisedimenticolia bacterium]
MAFEAGQSLLHYRLAEAIGEGGMGVVWKAIDTTLNRPVAIKILPDMFAEQPDRLARFEREARLLASLNHPNIAAIYGFHEAKGARFLAMELVGGEDLDKRIKGGTLPLDETLRIALQIAEGLETAHEHGVVHRDLKPANIQVTDEGQVKILDFGLAKALAGDPGSSSTSASLSPTLTSAGTRAGVILGTAAYMSPEQAKGKPVDRRTDIWAFGAVLYEMLTAKRLFDGETVSEMIAGVLKTEPDLSTLPPKTPAALRRLIKRCLEKDPRHRLRDIGDARVALEEIQSGRGDEPVAATAAAAPAKSSALPVAIGAVLAAAVTGGAAWFLQPAPMPPPPVRLEALVTGDQPLLTIQGSAVALSADGRFLAYAIGTASDVSATKMYLRNLSQFEDTPLAGTDAAYNPFFSPEGQWIGFVTPQALKKVSISGGTPLVLCNVALSRGATWGANGTIVFAPNPASGLMQVPAAGGTPTPVTTLAEGEASHRWPQFLPGGEKVLFTTYTSGDRNAGRIEVVDLKSGRRTVVHQGGTYGRYSASGHLLYLNNRTLFAAPFDLGALKMTALPAPVLQDLGSNLEGGAQFDVSANGTIVYLTGQSQGARNQLVWMDRQGKATPIGETRREYQAPPRLSPEGKRVAVPIVADGNTDIWIIDLVRDTQTRLTFDEGRDLYPVWSHDGQYVYFTSNRAGKWAILRKHADGTGAEETMASSDNEMDVYSASSDGKYLGFHYLTASGDTMILPLQGEHQPHPIFTSAASDGDPVFSQDVKWFSYDSDESGRWEVYVRPIDGKGGRWQISAQGGEFARWARDGSAIYYLERGKAAWKVPVKAIGTSFEVGRPEKLFDLTPSLQADWDIAPDGSRFLMIQGETSNAAAGRNMVKLTFNWFEDLGRLLAARP